MQKEVFCAPMRFIADEPGKPPLLLVHGFLSSRHHWWLNEPALRSRYRLIIAELPGHGATPPCHDPERLTPDALADCIEAARRHLGIERWHVCGQSLGAGITLRYALRHPHGVAAVAWTNSNRIVLDPLNAEQLASLDQRAQELENGGHAALRRERVYPGKARYFPERMRELLGRDADGVDLRTMIELLRSSLPRISLKDCFGKLPMPVLLINGRLERGFQPVRDLVAQLLPSMKIVDLDGGHSINIEQAEAFNASLLEFLSQHDQLIRQAAQVSA